MLIIAGSLFHEKYHKFFGRTYLSKEFRLEDEYLPLRSFGNNIVDLMYFNMDIVPNECYLVLELVIKRRNMMTSE